MRPLIWYWYDVKLLWYRVSNLFHEALPRTAAFWIADHTEQLAYWVFIRVACRRAHLCRCPDEVTIMDVLKTFP